MKKTLKSVLISLSVLTGLLLPSGVRAAEEYTEQEVTACLYAADDTEKMNILFKDELPDIPYLSVSDYLSRIYDHSFTEKEETDGVFTLSGKKMTLSVDTKKETVSIDGYAGGIDANVNNRHSTSSKEETFVREGSKTVLRGKDTATFRLKNYGIDLLEANGKSYIPLATLNDLFSLSYNGALYMNGKLNFIHTMEDAPSSMYVKTDSLYKKTTRTKSTADFTYREFCFMIDHLYGRPSKSSIAKSIEAKGLDKTLSTLNEDTKAIRTLLQSEKTLDVMLGLTRLQTYFEDGGHTVFMLEMFLALRTYPKSALSKAWMKECQENLTESIAVNQILNKPAEVQAVAQYNQTVRSSSLLNYKMVKSWVFGEEAEETIALYRHGDTAVFVFDEFTNHVPSPFIWSLNYAKKEGLSNFVIDLSLNGGGSSAVLEYMFAAILNSRRKDNTFHTDCTSTVNGVITRTNNTFDLNLDGKFNSADKKVSYDFNYAVMITRNSYSCGNLFPFIAEKNGIVLLGERSGGGCCVVEKGYTADNHYFNLSAAFKLYMGKGIDVDKGAPVDYHLADKDKKATAEMAQEGYRNVEAINYKRLYDLASVSAKIHEFYGDCSSEWVSGRWFNKNGKQTYTGIGAWKKTSAGWTYSDSKGWSAKNCWQKINGKWYFFDKKGIMEKDAYRRGYYLQKNGAWDGKGKVSGWIQDKEGWYFALNKSSSYLKNTWKKINGSWYRFNKKGYMTVSEFVKGWWVNKSGKQTDPVKYTWYKTKNSWWYGKKNGWYAKNSTYTIDGKAYSFDTRGYLVTK